jgi:predicted amidohydrolase
MQLGLIQLEAELNTDANVDRAEGYIRDAVSRGADLVLLPEIWNVGYFAFDKYATGAESIEGPTPTRMADLADELDVYLHAGSIVEESEEHLYNTSLLFGPNGERLGVYRKMHLFGYESEESKLLTPGERIVTIDTDFGTVGMTTCYDLRFPELYRALRDQGADLFLITSAWPQARLDHWRLFNQTRAVEEQVFLAAANLVGTNQGEDLGGNSLVVDPWGVPRANGGFDEGVTTAEIELGKVKAVRDEFPTLADRHIDIEYRYRPIHHRRLDDRFRASSSRPTMVPTMPSGHLS